MGLIERGMCKPALDAYVTASKEAGINIAARDNLRVVQAIGDAPASHGYHHKDGTLNGHAYTAAADLSVRDLSRSQIASWLEELCSQGFVAFFRNWPGNTHIHANYAGVPQKRSLDGQNEDFFAGRDGLVGHSRIASEWWYPDKDVRWIPEKMFRLSNPKSGEGRVVTRADVVPKPLPEVPPLTYGLYLNKEAKPRLWMPVLDGVAYAPVRAWGSILGFDVSYHPEDNTVTFDNELDSPIAVKFLHGVGHSPIRQLVHEAGLKLDLDGTGKAVHVHR